MHQNQYIILNMLILHKNPPKNLENFLMILIKLCLNRVRTLHIPPNLSIHLDLLMQKLVNNQINFLQNKLRLQILQLGYTLLFIILYHPLLILVFNSTIQTEPHPLVTLNHPFQQLKYPEFGKIVLSFFILFVYLDLDIVRYFVLYHHIFLNVFQNIIFIL